MDQILICEMSVSFELETCETSVVLVLSLRDELRNKDCDFDQSLSWNDGHV